MNTPLHANKKILLWLCLFCLAAPVAYAKRKPANNKSSATAVKEAEFLIALPKNFTTNYVRPAQKIKKALAEKTSAARQKALLAQSSRAEFADLIFYLLAQENLDHGEYRKAREYSLRLINDYPASLYTDKAKAFLPKIELTLASKNNDGGESYLRAFQRIPSREWPEYEQEILLAAQALQKNSDRNIYLGFLMEVLLNLPSETKIKKELLSGLNADENKDLLKQPKLRDPSFQAGVKAEAPDAQLIDSAFAAIQTGDWSLAQDKFALLAKTYPESDHLDRARYWEIVCRWERGQKDAAKAAFAAFFREQPLTYYGMLAAQRAELSPLDALSPAPPAIKPMETLEGNLIPRQRRSLLRGKAFLQVGLMDFARADLENLYQLKPGGSTIGSESPRTLLSLANLYYESGYYLGAFTHGRIAFQLDRALFSRENLKYSFPELAFKEAIDAAALGAGIHPLLLRSLIKQESAFLPDAVSRSNAFGLTQVIFPTAREIQADAVREQLFQPEFSTKWGAIYVQRQLERFQGNLILTLAAYNAGPTRAGQWQKKWQESKSTRMDLLVESIPFTETRKYVSSILRNFAWYKLMAGEKFPVTLEELASQWAYPQVSAPPN